MTQQQMSRKSPAAAIPPPLPLTPTSPRLRSRFTRSTLARRSRLGPLSSALLAMLGVAGLSASLAVAVQANQVAPIPQQPPLTAVALPQSWPVKPVSTSLVNPAIPPTPTADPTAPPTPSADATASPTPTADPTAPPTPSADPTATPAASVDPASVPTVPPMPPVPTLPTVPPIPPVPTTPPVGELILESHQSAFLQTTRQFYVVLPQAYASSSRRFPVVYVLHGAWGSFKDWPNHMDVTKLADTYNVILVFPDGGQFGWYLDSPVEPTSQYESYFTKELIPYVDAHYLTIAQPQGRGIVGLSMGGHGAITLALKHPDLFTSASSLSGVLDLTRHPTSYELPKRLGPLQNNRAAWEANSALYLARRLTPDFSVKLFVDVGTSDFTLSANRAFAKELSTRGVPLKYVERPGTHNWDYWTANIAEHIAFHAAAFTAAPQQASELAAAGS